MRGAVAAGNRDSAEAGAWALREGGTCVDAALAATFAAFVTEGPLTGPSGGGFLVLHEPGASATVLDCFFAVPTAPRGEMDEVEIDFADASTQIFHVGEQSVAVPGLLAGLDEARIHTCGLCTAMHPEVLTSYRAEGASAGRLAGVIRATPERPRA